MKGFHSKPSKSLGPALGVLGALSLCVSFAHAGQECYDFSDLPLGSQYHVGDTVNAQHSVATLRQFYVNQNQPSQQAK